MSTPPSAPPPSRSRWAYIFLLRVPLIVVIAFLALPYLAAQDAASSLLLGLFDVQGIQVWAVATIAFMLALTILTTTWLILAYAEPRCGVAGLGVSFPIRPAWYVVAAC